MNKESIRRKIQEAKRDANKLLAEKKVPSEAAAIINTLILIIDIVVEVLLTKTPRKNSSNSGLPPSKNEGSNGNRNRGSGTKNKNGNLLNNTRNIETEEIISPTKCDSCHSDLSKVKTGKTEVRVRIDIIYEIVKHSIISEIKKCSSCSFITKGKFPKGYKGKVQYGIGIKASIINFLMVQMLSLERVQEHFRGPIGRSISQAIMLKYISQFSKSLVDWETKQINRLLSCPVIHCDETSLRVNKRNQWVHSYSYGDITLKFLHSKRGCEAIEEIGVIPQFHGIIIHDSWASYLSYGHVEHGLCGAHLLRELKFIEESTTYQWATNLKKLLQEAAKIVRTRTTVKKLYQNEYKRLQSRYRNILTRGLKELPDFPRKNGQRGRRKHSDAQNLWLRFKDHEESILLFARNKEVEFTNNRAERDLRDTKLKQKVSGTFRKHEFARHFVRISSYVKSMKYKGYSSLEAIMLALQGDIPI